MAVVYDGTHGAARLVDSPRRVYRVTVARTTRLAARNAALWPFFQWSFADAVRAGVDAGLSPLARYLGNPTVERDDTRAVFDVMAASGAGSADVRQLVERIDAASPYWRVVRIADAGDVPGFSAGGPDALGAGRDSELTRAREQAASETLLSRLAASLHSQFGSFRGAVAWVVFALFVLVLFAVFLRIGGSGGK